MSTVSHPIGIGNVVAFPNITEEFDLDTDGHETRAVYESPSADAATDHLKDVGTLVASRTERDDSEYTNRVPVEAHNQSGTSAHDDVRTAVAMDRYARERGTSVADRHARANRVTDGNGWLLPDQHEREFLPLLNPEQFDWLPNYLEDEMETVEAETVQQRVEILKTLCQHAPATPHEVSD